MNRASFLVATDGEPFEIRIDEPIEPIPYDVKDALDRQAKIFAAHAERLELALRNSLPGGLYDRLLGKMLEHKASHFIVRHT